VLLHLRRLTVGTTHGKFMSGVSIAALAPNLTAFEDLSEIMRQPLYASEWGALVAAWLGWLVRRLGKCWGCSARTWGGSSRALGCCVHASGVLYACITQAPLICCS
jgi:hypothetical protein